MRESTNRCTNCIHCIIITCNVVALIVSFAMINCGAILLWNAPLIKSLVGPFLTNLASGPVALNQKQVQDISGEFHSLIAPVGWAPFIFGFALFAASVLAFVGICCRNPDVLLAYAVLIGLLIIIPLLLIIIYVSDRSSMLGSAYNFLERNMMAYQNIYSNSTSSILMGTIMAGLQCCGVDNGSDFLKPGWMFLSYEVIQGTNFTNLQYPVPCCKLERNDSTTTTTTAPTSTTSTSPTTAPTGPTLPPIPPFDPNVCPRVFNENNSNIAIGCRKLFADRLIVFTDIIAFASVVPLLFSVLLLCLTIVLLLNYKRSFLL